MTDRPDQCKLIEGVCAGIEVDQPNPFITTTTRSRPNTQQGKAPPRLARRQRARKSNERRTRRRTGNGPSSHTRPQQQGAPQPETKALILHNPSQRRSQFLLESAWVGSTAPTAASKSEAAGWGLDRPGARLRTESESHTHPTIPTVAPPHRTTPTPPPTWLTHGLAQPNRHAQAKGREWHAAWP